MKVNSSIAIYSHGKLLNGELLRGEASWTYRRFGDGKPSIFLGTSYSPNLSIHLMDEEAIAQFIEQMGAIVDELKAERTVTIDQFAASQ